MAKSVFIQLTAGPAGNYQIFTDFDMFLSPLASGISLASLLAGYTFTNCPDTATQVRVRPQGSPCTTGTFTIIAPTATPTPTPSPTPTNAPTFTPTPTPTNTPTPTPTFAPATATPTPTPTVTPTPTPTPTPNYVLVSGEISFSTSIGTVCTTPVQDVYMEPSDYANYTLVNDLAPGMRIYRETSPGSGVITQLTGFNVITSRARSINIYTISSTGTVVTDSGTDC